MGIDIAGSGSSGPCVQHCTRSQEVKGGQHAAGGEERLRGGGVWGPDGQAGGSSSACGAAQGHTGDNGRRRLRGGGGLEWRRLPGCSVQSTACLHVPHSRRGPFISTIHIHCIMLINVPTIVNPFLLPCLAPAVLPAGQSSAAEGGGPAAAALGRPGSSAERMEGHRGRHGAGAIPGSHPQPGVCMYVWEQGRCWNVGG